MVILNPQDIIREAEKIARNFSSDAKVQDFLKALRIYVSTDTPSYNRKWRGMTNSMFDLPRDLREEFSPILLEYLQPWEESLGYRQGILTLQEHRLIGSTGASDSTDPYIPLGIIEERIPLDEIRTARNLVIYSTAHKSFYGLPINHNSITRTLLEDLDTNGRTTRDPRPVDNHLELITIYSKSKDFPFRRSI